LSPRRRFCQWCPYAGGGKSKGVMTGKTAKGSPTGGIPKHGRCIRPLAGGRKRRGRVVLHERTFQKTPKAASGDRPGGAPLRQRGSPGRRPQSGGKKKKKKRRVSRGGVRGRRVLFRTRGKGGLAIHHQKKEPGPCRSQGLSIVGWKKKRGRIRRRG